MQKDYFIRSKQRKGSMGDKTTSLQDYASVEMKQNLNKRSSKYIHGSMIIEKEGRDSSTVKHASSKQDSVTFNNTLLRHNLMNNYSSTEHKSDKSSQSPTLIRLNNTQIENPKSVKSKLPYIDT